MHETTTPYTFGYQPIYLIGRQPSCLGYEQLLRSQVIGEVVSTWEVFCAGLAEAAELLGQHAAMISINVEAEDLPYAVLELEDRQFDGRIWLEVVERRRTEVPASVLRWADARGVTVVADDVRLEEMIDLPGGYRVVKVEVAELADEVGARWFLDEAARRGMLVVVERVETPETLEMVTALGVAVVQGYHLGRAQALGRQLCLPL
jgi:EAL domain-containing protein (putative c-di-GMP-specific phosphodiesterase class I)